MTWPSKGFVLRKTTVNVNLTKYVEPISGTVTLKGHVTNLCGDITMTIVKGDSHSFEAQIFDSESTPVDLTGFEVRFGVKVNVSDLTYIIEKANFTAGGSSDEIDMTDPVNGIFEVHISPTDTENLREKGNNFVYEIEYRLGNIVKTPIQAELILTDDVIR